MLTGRLSVPSLSGVIVAVRQVSGFLGRFQYRASLDCGNKGHLWTKCHRSCIGVPALSGFRCVLSGWRAPHLFAPVAQLDLECHPPKVEVMGSSPIGDINKFLRSVAQPGRASALGAECRRFESGYSDEANLFGGAWFRLGIGLWRPHTKLVCGFVKTDRKDKC